MNHLFILSGQSNMRGIDPSTSFTPTVEAAFPQDTAIVVQHAEGGQPILRWYKEWVSATGERPAGIGEIYDKLMAKVYAAIDGVEVGTVTFVWMQGERDANEGYGEVYGASLKGLVAQLSRDLQRDEINVVIGRLSTFDMANERYRHWTLVRDTQVEVANSLPRAGWVDTDGLNGEANELHCTREGYAVLGERFARKAVELIRTGGQ